MFENETNDRAVAAVARVYTTLYRGTPLILQLVFVFTVLPHAGIVLAPVVAGGVALAMNEATFFAEISVTAPSHPVVPAGQDSATRARLRLTFFCQRSLGSPCGFSAAGG